MLEKNLNEELSVTDINVKYCMVRFRDFSLGTPKSKDPVFLTSLDGEAIRLEQLLPNIGSEFSKERALSSYFHIFYLPKTEGRNHQQVNRDTLVELVGKCVFSTLQIVLRDFNEGRKKKRLLLRYKDKTSGRDL